MASRALRPVIAFAVLFGWCGVFGAPACTKTYSCTGDFTSSNCAELDATQCTHVHGCHTRKPTCVNGCDVGMGCEESANPTCRHAGGACTSLCAGALAAADCDDMMASLGGPSIYICEWTTEGADGGGSCESICLPLKSQKACDEHAAAGCSWVSCEGTVKDDCSSYSGDDCPTYLGCDRTTDPV